MKRLSLITSIIASAGLLLFSCKEDDETLGALEKPTNLEFTVTPSTDGSGEMVFHYKSTGTVTHKVVFNSITSLGEKYVTTENDKTFTTNYTMQGTYDIIYYAYGTGGKYDSIIKKGVYIKVDFKAPDDIVANLSGGSSKTWVWDKSSGGHLGVGDPAVNYAGWWNATANEKPDCLYNDKLVFSVNSAGKLEFVVQNQGDTFIHKDHQQSMVGQTTGSDNCFNYTAPAAEEVAFSSASTTGSTGVAMNFSKAFMSYGLETHSYEIMSIDESTMVVRTVDTDPAGAKRAWYHRFVAEEAPSTCAGGATGNTIVPGTYTLVWADEFNTDGSPCSNSWGYDIGTGSGGWGNGESQYYTKRTDNVKVAGGNLVITAKKEYYLGSNYTSARLKTQGKFDFKYGKVEVRAKLPVGKGTWPAIWMLGSNLNQVGWPACGEIDIMEHTGNNLNKILGTTHTLAGSGGSAVGGSTTITDVSQFHIYGMEWDATSLKFYVDGNLYYTYQPTQTAQNWPFDKNQFLILNLAMGGGLGGTIDPAFTQESMQVDYVRVYQK